MKKSESNSEMDITGCNRKFNPMHNKGKFKYNYEIEELEEENVVIISKR